MPYDPKRHHRRSIRLKGYDYSQAGLYFITICVQDRKCLFGKIENGEMILNEAGKMVENEWLKLPQRFPNIELHPYQVMPNHFHSILEIITPSGETVGAPVEETVGATVCGTVGETVGETVGATLVVAHTVAPNEPPAPNERYQSPLGQPQGIAPTGIAPTGIAPIKTELTETDPTKINSTEISPKGTDPTKKSKTVGDMVGAFQSIVTVEYIRGVKQLGWEPFNKKLFQRNYWEHIIRNELSYHRISNYIINNPKNWGKDKLK